VLDGFLSLLGVFEVEMSLVGRPQHPDSWFFVAVTRTVVLAAVVLLVLVLVEGHDDGGNAFPVPKGFLVFQGGPAVGLYGSVRKDLPDPRHGGAHFLHPAVAEVALCVFVVVVVVSGGGVRSGESGRFEQRKRTE